MSTPADFPLLADSLLGAIRRLAGSGLCPATGGNFSARIDANLRLISQSGRDKNRMELSDLMLCDTEGQALDARCKASDETPLHMALYALDAQIGCVLHTHSVAATVLSRQCPGHSLNFSGYEMQKALSGQSTHEATMELRVFDNTQDMAALAQELREHWRDHGPLTVPALLVRGHGLYAWGHNVAQALRHVEGLEFLLSCLLQERLLGAPR